MAVTNYIWDVANDSYLMETDGTGVTTAEYTNEPGQYEPLMSQRRDGVTGTYHFDGQGSMRQLTDESKVVADTAIYTAFGDEVVCSGATSNPFGFAGSLGYYANPETNDIYVRARTYDADLSRWLSSDPVRYTRGYDNLFRYCRNSPIVLSDPSGLQPPPSHPWQISPNRPLPNEVRYRPGRGFFNAASIVRAGAYLPTWTGYLNIDTSTELVWEFTNKAFLNPKCCCNEIGFLQIYTSGGTIARFNNPWKIDNGVPYNKRYGPGDPSALPYRINPCTAKPPKIGVADRPGIDVSPKNTYIVKSRNMDYEICVYCISGPEAGGHPKEGSGRGITVYGCIKWGWSISRKAGAPPNTTSQHDYTFTRYIDGVSNTGGSGTAAWLSAPYNAAPSHIFAKTVVGANAFRTSVW